MAIDAGLLEVLRCPETHQAVHEAEAALVADLNRRIAEGTLTSRSGQAISEPLDGGLVRDDGAVLYPVRDEIPEMLIDSGITLS